MQKKASLRRKLLSWLVPLLLLLILVDTTILYRLAINKLGQELDVDLYRSTKDIAQFLSEFGNSPPDIHLLENASKIFLNDEVDKILYSISDSQGKLLSGSAALQQAASSSEPLTTDHTYYNATIAKEEFRVVRSEFNIRNPQNTEVITIQIASTQKWRRTLSNTILLGLVVPQLLLALLSFFIIWYGVKKGLAPLDALQDEIYQRSEQDLSPIELPNIPQEVSLVTNAVNQLMHKLQTLISAQNRFVADAAHQLRTPLAGAQAQLELAEQETAPAAVKAMLPRAYQSLDKLLHTINQLLTLARSQPEATASFHMVQLNLNTIVKEVALEMAPAALKKHIDLGFEPSLVPALIKGNVERLNDMLINLIDNAIRYTQHGGKVTVALDVSETLVNLIIEDNGPGVSAAEQDKIFDRFHRVVGNAQAGSGLGLAIVKEIANLHGASIHISDASTDTETKGLKVSLSFHRIQND